MASAMVSPALKRRIANHLDAGYQPSINGRRVVLRDVVLIRSSGDEAPAANEVRRQAASRGIDINITYWDREAAVEQQGNKSFAFDITGHKHLIVHKRNSQKVVTLQGRRFYSEAPQTKWLVHLPVVNVRSVDGRRAYFGHRIITLTEEVMEALFSRASPEHRLLNMLRTRDGADERTQFNQMMTAWAELFPPNKVIPGAWEYEDVDHNVTTVVDNRPITFSAEFTGVTRTGQRTVDTFLDQTVFGAPITSFDLWQKTHLHESSRRANNQCGIDVIAASPHVRTGHVGSNKPRFTAQEAAQRLVTLAKEHFQSRRLLYVKSGGVEKLAFETQGSPKSLWNCKIDLLLTSCFHTSPKWKTSSKHLNRWKRSKKRLPKATYTERQLHFL